MKKLRAAVLPSATVLFLLASGIAWSAPAPDFVPASIVSWGYDSCGQATSPGGREFVIVSAGGYHSLALRADGTLAGWGENSSGQTDVPEGDDFVAVSAGGSHSLALRSDGTLVGWGGNGSGQANVPAGNDFVAVAAGGSHSLALKADGSVVGWGSSLYGLADVPQGDDFVAISAGGFHSLALKSDGALVGWGANGDGQTNVPEGDDFVAVSAGHWHSLALRSDGSVIGWGYDFFGQASPPLESGLVSVSAGGLHSLALRADGSVVGWGCYSDGQIDVPGGKDFLAVSAGFYHSLALVDSEAPVVVSVTGPAAPVAAGAEVVVEASFTDADTDDTHTAMIDWGDGCTTDCTVREAGGCGTATGSHVYSNTGAYSVNVRVVDEHSCCCSSCYEYVVVFDPDAGFVTGRGWIESPAGAYSLDPELSGRADFSFDSRYEKVSPVPEGTTEFSLRAGGLDFRSNTQEWLVVNGGGSEARFKGSGTLNGAIAPDGEPFKFMISVEDGKPGGGADTLRLKIWYADDTVVYDNGAGQPIAGGSVSIRAKSTGAKGGRS
ncbi:MAG: PKD domain-containing protein [Coriobacteriia bacterium]|nr:PKD domain-containing protein [Coriobacteriia bacterium]